MDVRSAELTKYAANAMLATRISFMNELANLADALGADIEHGAPGHRLRSAHRLPLSVSRRRATAARAFPRTSRRCRRRRDQHGHPLRILAAVEAVNEAQKLRLVDEDRRPPRARTCTGSIFAMWGLAFKPNTDDMREAPSREIIAALVQRGARVVAYDPIAMDEAQARFRPMPALSLREVAARRADRRRRAGGRHRVAGVPQSRFRRTQARAAPAAAVRRPQPVRSRSWCAPPASNTSASGGDDIDAPPQTVRRLSRSRPRAPAFSSSATSCSTATGSATSSASRRKRRCRW